MSDRQETTSDASLAEALRVAQLRANPQLQRLQQTGRGADNIHTKKFAGGMDLQIRWPVIGNFSQNEYFTVLLTDRDRMPDDVDGEGDPFMLARKRVQHAGSLGMVVSESSPGRPIERDELVQEAADRAWVLFIQRDYLGLKTDHHLLSTYDIPREVMLRIGVFGKRSSGER